MPSLKPPPNDPFLALNMIMLQILKFSLSDIIWVKSLKVSAKRQTWEAALAVILSVMRGWERDLAREGCFSRLQNPFLH